jgi:hypothetical protein
VFEASMLALSTGCKMLCLELNAGFEVGNCYSLVALHRLFMSMQSMGLFCLAV